MRAVVISLFALGTVVSGSIAASAQSFEIGPGGVRIYEDRPRVYEDRPRVYEERPRVYEERGLERRRGLCAELRDACYNKDRYGEGGQGKLPAISSNLRMRLLPPTGCLSPAGKVST